MSRLHERFNLASANDGVYSPQHLQPLPYPVSKEVEQKIIQKEKSGDIIEEEGLQSGTKSHMPHNRLQLASRKDKLEERIVCGCEWLGLHKRTNG